MDLDTTKIIKELKKITEDMLAEDELVDDFGLELNKDAAKVSPSLSDTLHAKTKISRALEFVKEAIEDFKEATIAELDLIADADITAAVEKLTNAYESVEALLAGKSAEKVEETEEEEEAPVEDEPTEETVEEETVDEEPAEGEEVEDEVDFDDEAGLDLFGG